MQRDELEESPLLSGGPGKKIVPEETAETQDEGAFELTEDTRSRKREKGGDGKGLQLGLIVVFLLVALFLLVKSGGSHKAAVKNAAAGTAKCVAPPYDARDACATLEAFLGQWDTYDPPLMQKGIDTYTTPDFSLHLALENSGYLDIFRPNVGLRMQENMVDKDMLGFDFGPSLVVGAGSGSAAAPTLFGKLEALTEAEKQKIEAEIKARRDHIEARIQEEREAIASGFLEKKEEIEKMLESERAQLAQLESKLFFLKTTSAPSDTASTEATPAPALDTSVGSDTSSTPNIAGSGVTITRAGKMSLRGMTWVETSKMSYIMKSASYPESKASGLSNCEDCEAKEIFKLIPKDGKWLLAEFTILKLV